MLWPGVIGWPLRSMPSAGMPARTWTVTGSRAARCRSRTAGSRRSPARWPSTSPLPPIGTLPPGVAVMDTGGGPVPVMLGDPSCTIDQLGRQRLEHVEAGHRGGVRVLGGDGVGVVLARADLGERVPLRPGGDGAGAADDARPLGPAELLGRLTRRRPVGDDDVEDLGPHREVGRGEDHRHLFGGGDVLVGVGHHVAWRPGDHVVPAERAPTRGGDELRPRGRVSVKTTPSRFCVPPAARVRPTRYV